LEVFVAGDEADELPQGSISDEVCHYELCIASYDYQGVLDRDKNGDKALSKLVTVD